jgi:hypothetical protein
MQEVHRTSADIVLNKTIFEWITVSSPRNTATRPQLGYGCNPLLLVDNASTEELRMRGSGEITLRAMCDTETFDLSTVEEIAIMAELRPVNTEVPVAARASVSKVDGGTMNAKTSWIYEIKPGMVEL